MTFDKKLKTNFSKKLATILVLSATLSCYPVYSNENDFAYYNFVESKPILLANQIHLDTSQAEKFIPKTSIPYNLRGFSEADYFSSSIEEAPTATEVSQPQKAQPTSTIDLDSMPLPSQYKKVNTVVKEVEPVKIEDNIIKNSGFIDNGFAPLPTANSFFAPVEEKQEEAPVVQNVEINKEIHEAPKVVEVEKVEKVEEEKTVIKEVFAENQPKTELKSEPKTVSENQENSNIDLDGRIIANVSFSGLEKVNPDLILSIINIQKGAIFNQDLVQKDLQKIYSMGFFTDEMSVDPTLRSDGEVDLHYSLKENVLVKDVSIIGNSIIATTELIGFVSPLKNMPQNLNKINEAIDNITGYYHEKGYILASISSVDDDSEGNLNFTVNEGIINKIKIEGNEKTKDYVIERNIMTSAGTVYHEETLKKDLAKVFSTQIFEEIDRKITPSEENEGTYDISVVVKEKANNSIGFGGGIDTGLGAFGSITFKEDNFLGRGQKLAVSGLLGSGVLLSDASIKNRMNYQAEISLFEPHFLNSDNSLMSRLYLREMGSWQIPLAIERRIGLSSTVEHRIKGYEHLSTSFTAGVEHINLKEGDFNSISKMYNRYNLNIKDRAKQLEDGFFVHLAPGIKYSNLDDEEVPREGIIAQARFNEAIGITDFKHTNGRLSGAITKFFPVFKKSSFSLTAKAGLKIHGDDMPEVMAYRLGGPYTIRGFKMNGVGTGESFVMGSAELATPLPFVDRLKWDFIKKMRLTFFVDAGQIFDPTISSYLYDRPLHAITAGIGLRVHVPGLGPISVDYGIPFTNTGDLGSSGGYFTFGSGGLNMYGY